MKPQLRHSSGAYFKYGDSLTCHAAPVLGARKPERPWFHMENPGQHADSIPGVLVYFTEGEFKVLRQVGRPSPVAFPASVSFATAFLSSVAAAFAVRGLPRVDSDTQTGSLRILFNRTRGFLVSGWRDCVSRQLEVRVEKSVHACAIRLVVA